MPQESPEESQEEFKELAKLIMDTHHIKDNNLFEGEDLMDLTRTILLVLLTTKHLPNQWIRVLCLSHLSEEVLLSMMLVSEVMPHRKLIYIHLLCIYSLWQGITWPRQEGEREWISLVKNILQEETNTHMMLCSPKETTCLLLLAQTKMDTIECKDLIMASIWMDTLLQMLLLEDNISRDMEIHLDAKIFLTEWLCQFENDSYILLLLNICFVFFIVQFHFTISIHTQMIFLTYIDV